MNKMSDTISKEISDLLIKEMAESAKNGLMQSVQYIDYPKDFSFDLKDIKAYFINRWSRPKASKMYLIKHEEMSIILTVFNSAQSELIILHGTPNFLLNSRNCLGSGDSLNNFQCKTRRINIDKDAENFLKSKMIPRVLKVNLHDLRKTVAKLSAELVDALDNSLDDNPNKAANFIKEYKDLIYMKDLYSILLNHVNTKENDEKPQKPKPL